MLIVKFLVFNFIASKKCTKYQLIASKLLDKLSSCLLSNEYKFIGVNN